MRITGFVLADEDVSAPGPVVETGADVPGYSGGAERFFGPDRLRGEWLFGFGARVAGEQCAQSFLWGKPLVENGVYGIDDGGAHPGVAGGVVNRFGIGDAFGDHGHGREDGRERRSPAEGLADAVIPAMFAVAGDDEVADAAEPLEGSGGTAHGGAEADHFG